MWKTLNSIWVKEATTSEASHWHSQARILGKAFPHVIKSWYDTLPHLINDLLRIFSLGQFRATTGNNAREVVGDSSYLRVPPMLVQLEQGLNFLVGSYTQETIALEFVSSGHK
eukprot:TRINITY_DN20005_c0_g1_i2.p1 TRINITY_DN20005_c0_g1~~TRINITY_DN20005_c0_g1_i2.p1  ORF type:complete len:113 (+),score=1.95 TRINITY_DN20005_c0_g1_i2:172-510(+)